MAVRQTSGAWNGNENGAYWGLTRKIGPWTSTKEDVKRMNSQAGGPHAGHANWYTSAEFHPYIQSKVPKNFLKYVVSPDVMTSEDMKPPTGMKIPGISKSGVMKGVLGARGIPAGLGIGPLRDKEPTFVQDGVEGSGVGSGREVVEDPTVKVSDVKKAFDLYSQVTSNPARKRKRDSYDEPSTKRKDTRKSKRDSDSYDNPNITELPDAPIPKVTPSKRSAESDIDFNIEEGTRNRPNPSRLNAIRRNMRLLQQGYGGRLQLGAGYAH